VSFFDGDPADRLKPAEVFVKVAKHGSIVAGLIDGITAVVSMAMQYGVPWDAIRDKFLHHNFERNGDDQNTSLLDGIAKAVEGVIKQRADIIGEGGDGAPVSTKPKPKDPAPLSAIANIVEAVIVSKPEPKIFTAPHLFGEQFACSCGTVYPLGMSNPSALRCAVCNVTTDLEAIRQARADKVGKMVARRASKADMIEHLTPTYGKHGGPRVKIYADEIPPRATFEDGSECTLNDDYEPVWKTNPAPTKAS
jgi:hypothetical protein